MPCEEAETHPLPPVRGNNPPTPNRRPAKPLPGLSDWPSATARGARHGASRAPERGLLVRRWSKHGSTSRITWYAIAITAAFDRNS